MGTAPEIRAAGLFPTGPSGPWHEALAYTSPSDFGDRLAPRIEEAVAAGDRVLVVLDDDTGQELHTALGPTAAAVRFAQPGEVHRGAGLATAVRWARSGREVDRTMIVGQQLPDLPGCGWDYWMRLCVGLEVAMAGLPLTVVCPFVDDAAGWDRVRGSHRVLGAASGARANPAYRPPHELIHDLPPPPCPSLGRPAAELAFGRRDLGAVRGLTAEQATRSGLDADRVAEVVLAVNELATNSVEHGSGAGRLRLWIGAELVAEVADHGSLVEPFPGMVCPPVDGARGRGLWIASELSDALEAWTGDGTVIRLRWRVAESD
jgi:anti-sigma regulatory factor (Ser/Thr protein kinase)